MNSHLTGVWAKKMAERVELRWRGAIPMRRFKASCTLSTSGQKPLTQSLTSERREQRGRRPNEEERITACRNANVTSSAVRRSPLDFRNQTHRDHSSNATIQRTCARLRRVAQGCATLGNEPQTLQNRGVAQGCAKLRSLFVIDVID